MAWAVCENGVDVCLEQQPATETDTPPTADNAVSTEVNALPANNAASIDSLVDGITTDLKVRRLTKPVGNNALEKIRRLQQLAPEHDYAVNGYRYVARIYLSIARNELKNNRVERAIARLDAATDVDPSLPGLAAVAQQIKSITQAQANETDQPVKAEPVVKPGSKPQSAASTTAADIDEPEVISKVQVEPDSAAGDTGSEQRAGVLITPVMVGLPAGSFVMGSESGADNEKPAHPVQVDAFSMSRYEITRDQYREFRADTGGEVRQLERSKALLPVAGVTSDEAIAYTRWLSAKTGKRYRLPTEAEWEYAVRAGTVTPYHTGDVIFGFANCLTCLDEVLQKSTPVGSFAPNAFGLYDMHGNVAEWTSSCLTENYFRTDERPEQVCTARVVRGGSWRSTREQVRSSYRVGQLSSGRSMDTGFRVVHDGL